MHLPGTAECQRVVESQQMQAIISRIAYLLLYCFLSLETIFSVVMTQYSQWSGCLCLARGLAGNKDLRQVSAGMN